MEKTTIQVNKDTLTRLKSFKNHPLESYDVTINILLDETEVEVLTENELQEIKQSLENVRQGKVKTIEQVAREMGISLT